MLKKQLKLMITMMLLFAITINAQEAFVHEDAGVSITLPAGWFYETNEDNLFAYSEDESVALSFSILNASNLDSALEEIDEMLKSEYDNIELMEAEELDVNGMNALWINGSADELEMAFLIVDPPYEDIVLFVSAWGSEEAVDEHFGEIEMIFNNISPNSD